MLVDKKSELMSGLLFTEGLNGVVAFTVNG